MNERFSHLTCAAKTDSGTVRTNNEDAFFVSPSGGVFGVSDGMGGGDAGEVASAWVAEELLAAADVTDSPGLLKTAIAQAVARANTRIVAHSREKGYRLMGATVAVAAVDPWKAGRLLIGHAGDSRVYRWRHGCLERLTEDHTVGATLADKIGDRSLSDPSRSSLSHVLTRAVGVADSVGLDWKSTDLRKGDRVLVCTDGVPTALDDVTICKVLSVAANPQDAASALIAAARDARAVDNITAVVAFADGEFPSDVVPPDEDLRESLYMESRCI